MVWIASAILAITKWNLTWRNHKIILQPFGRKAWSPDFAEYPLFTLRCSQQPPLNLPVVACWGWIPPVVESCSGSSVMRRVRACSPLIRFSQYVGTGSSGPSIGSPLQLLKEPSVSLEPVLVVWTKMAHFATKLVQNALFYTGFTMLASAFFKTRALWCALMHSATK